MYGNSAENIPKAFNVDAEKWLKEQKVISVLYHVYALREDRLMISKVTHVVFGGLHGDLAVSASAMRAAKLGFNSYFVEDAVRYLNDTLEKRESVRRILDFHGVKRIRTGDIVGEFEGLADIVVSHG